MIAHRPNMLAHVDKMLLLRNGQVEALGMRDEMMKLISRPARGRRTQVRARRSQTAYDQKRGA